jgi:hypothetical protein
MPYWNGLLALLVCLSGKFQVTLAPTLPQPYPWPYPLSLNLGLRLNYA